MENESQLDMFDTTPMSIKPNRNSPLEKEVEKYLIRKLKTIGAKSWKFVSINNRGVSDRIVLYRGRVIFVEVKREKGALSPKQRLFGEVVYVNNGEFVVVEGHSGVQKFCDRLVKEKSVWFIGWSGLFSIVVRMKELEWFK